MTTYLENNENEAFEKQCGIIDSLNIAAPLILDVGANIGQSVEKYRHHFPDCRIHSFEPNPAAFEKLVQSWGDTPGITLHSQGLNSKPGIFQFHVTNTPEASSLLPPDPKLMKLSVKNKYDFRKIDVECTTLDQFCISQKINHIDILKQDVQGAELEVLKGGGTLA